MDTPVLSTYKSALGHLQHFEWQKKRQEAIAYFKEKPAVCVAVAAGAGFVLGGGLTTTTALRLVQKGLGLVVQMAVVPFLLTRLRDALVDTVDEE